MNVENEIIIGAMHDKGNSRPNPPFISLKMFIMSENVIMVRKG